MNAAIKIGQIELSSAVFLAPMTGVTDLPFRKTVHNLGAGLVISEMVASRELVNGRADVKRRAMGDDLDPFVIQLVGCDAELMAASAKIAQRAGAQIIDINMGCPSREVTGKHCGSALMRDLDHAECLIKAVVKAVSVPVTLKMRLGWDRNSLNAPELAQRAESCGIQLITVHARTRCDFFKGEATWADISDVKAAVTIPVIANGDITSPDTAKRALELSKADGVMIGRGAYGAPWMPNQVSTALKTGNDPGPPPHQTQRDIALNHIQNMFTHYGSSLGVRIARKHVGWYLEQNKTLANEIRISWRRFLCTRTHARDMLNGLERYYEHPHEVPAQ